MASILPLLELSGEPRERGRAHGEAFREEIGTLLPAYFDYLDRMSPRDGVDRLTRARALEITRTYLGPAEAYASDLLSEVRGIAEGANAPFEEVLALNAFLDLCDYLSPAFAEVGCTTFMVPGNADGSGAIIGQSYDLPAFFAPAGALLKVTGEEGPEALVFTIVGTLGCAGLNSAGVGVVINNLVPADAGAGVPYPFVIRKILSSERIGDAIDALVAERRASGMNYVLCDRHGDLFDLETSAADYEVLCPFDGPMAHANHYLTERLKPLERRDWSQRGNSILRWGRATRLLRAAERPDAETLKRALGDHVDSPLSICRHDEVHDGEGCGQTICGIVLEPSEDRAWIARGPCCEHEWTEYWLSKKNRDREETPPHPH